MYAARETILKMREGTALQAGELQAFVAGLRDGDVTDAQVAAFAMAVCFRGMSLDEQIALTLAMRDSGCVLRWSGLDGPVLDKHSTGGVGDLVSLVLGPLLAAAGAFVPMISGRGLGHTGGTLDKLEAIPGFDTSPPIDTFQRLVRSHGVAIVGQSSELVPADRRLYAIRDETGTVASTPLIVSSILSKKLAEGLDALVMDVKFGSGAVIPDRAEATELARWICRVSRLAGLPCTALVTSMEQPLAWSAGNALEVREAIGFLRGDDRNPRLQEVVLALATEALQLGGLAGTGAEAQKAAKEALDSGAAAERFAAMVAGQGGPAGLIDRPETFLPDAPVVRPLHAGRPGHVARIDTRAVGLTVVRLGGGRQRAQDRVDPSVGLSALCSPGQKVGPDAAPLAVIHAANDADWQNAAEALREAIEVSTAAVPATALAEPLSVVRDRIDGVEDEPA
jgi:thymidine phosphorylase